MKSYELMKCPECDKEVRMYEREIGNTRLVCPSCDKTMEPAKFLGRG